MVTAVFFRQEAEAAFQCLVGVVELGLPPLLACGPGAP